MPISAAPGSHAFCPWLNASPGLVRAAGQDELAGRLVRSCVALAGAPPCPVCLSHGCHVHTYAIKRQLGADYPKVGRNETTLIALIRLDFAIIFNGLSFHQPGIKPETSG